MATNSRGQQANPLDKYRSFTYQHLFMAANSTEQIRLIEQADFENGADLTKFENASLTSPISPAGINGDGVFLICDGRRNSNFTIKTVEYLTTLNGATAVSSQVFAGELTMTLYDPNGILFMNYLQYLQDEVFKTDTYGFCWGLKTLFVGHTDENTTEIITTSFISLILTDIDVNFDLTGGNYTLKFTAAAAGAPLGQTIPSFVGHSSTNVVSDSNRTLISVIQNFQNRMNKELKDYYDKLRIIQLNATNSASADQSVQNVSSTGSPNQGKLVQYMITIPEDWYSWTVDGVAANHEETDYVKLRQIKSQEGSQTSQDKKQKPNTSVGAVNINFQVNSSIDAALAEIFNHCDQYKSLADASKRANASEPLKVMKTLSSITSDSKSLVMHWDVIEYEVPSIPKAPPIEESKTAPPTTSFGTQSQVASSEWNLSKDAKPIAPKNSLTFDYYFSGKNHDIISFDMIAHQAQTLLNTSMVHAVGDKILHDQKNNAAPKATEEKINVDFIRKNTPIFMPPKSKEQLTAYSYIAPGSSQSATINQEQTKALADLYYRSSIESKIRIRGNSDLLAKSTQSLPPHVTSSNGALTTDSNIDQTSMKAYRDHLNKRVIAEQTYENSSFERNFATYPLFIKVNIYSPDVNFDGTFKGGQFGVKKFWFDQYYRAYFLTSTFANDGTFTQEIQMGAYKINEEPAEKNITNDQKK